MIQHVLTESMYSIVALRESQLESVPDCTTDIISIYRQYACICYHTGDDTSVDIKFLDGWKRHAKMFPCG